MANILSPDPIKEDANTIIQAMVINKYLSHHTQNPELQISVQLLKPESITHYEMSLNKETTKHQLICIENFKLSLLAKSCVTPGLISFASNLIKTAPEAPDPSIKGSYPEGDQWNW